MLSTTFTNDTFTGWACAAKDEPLREMELPLKTWDENCVDMDIICCGVCGTDIHTLEGNFGACNNWPYVVGHEIVGKITRVGKNVTNVSVGDRVGLGCQVDSCGKCEECLKGQENLCTVRIVLTYNDTCYNGDKTYGGYANRWRGDCRFVCRIPDAMSSEDAASFRCAGLTVFAPFKRLSVNSESVVGILGIGGLGHYGILFAKAMGAKVVGMSHNDKKKDVALELGADEYVVTSDPDALSKYKNKLTHILCTGTGRDFQWETYGPLFRPNGIFINVGLPEWNFPEIRPMLLAMSQVTICGSAIGSPAEIEDMLQFAAKTGVKPWLQTYPMSEAPKAVEDFRAGKPRFRFVLKN